MVDTDTPMSPDPAAVDRPRVAVIGDIGGHRRELEAELRRLGADPDDGTLPPGLRVVQVGDLVHRGPDSAGVVRLVQRYLRDQPEQWTQLVGNHEAQYLGPPRFEWPERLPEAEARMLNEWWTDGRMSVATAVRTATESFLITHAGLTRGFWREVLDRLVRPDRAAAALNSLIGSHQDVLFHAGEMLHGAPDPIAGPVWAAAATELVPGWLGVRLPFSQVHGHSRVRPYGRGRRGAGGDRRRCGRRPRDQHPGRRPDRRCRPRARHSTADALACLRDRGPAWMGGMSTELILIRHGESFANVNPVIGGMRGDEGLTERGHAQAARLGKRLQAEQFSGDVLYASTLPRAQQTAAYVAEATGLSVVDDDDLQELRPGEADGLSFEEWRERWPRHPTAGCRDGRST